MRDRRHDTERPPGSGGKARARLDAFQEARGLMDRALASQYSAGLAAAIAAAGTPAASLPQWRLVGPELTTNGQTWTPHVVPVSGRVEAIAIDPSDRNHLLCGSTSGGIWESFTRGADWVPRTDSMLTLVTGAIAFDPGNPATVYAGTGDGNSYWFYGQGILRSADGGTTWSLAASSTFSGTGFYKIIVDPANGQHILAATYAGLHESTDGGTTWSPQRTVKTWDISMAPGGGPAAEVLAGSADGVQQSADGGHTWTALTLPGAPAAWERIAVSIAPSDPSVAFVYGADSSDKPYLWQRSGGAWSAIPAPTTQEQQAWTTWYVAAAPDRTDQVYVGAFDVHRGDLAAGTWTWTNLSSKDTGDSIHPDQRAIVFEPGDPSTIYCGCDGGLFRSPDRGNMWISLNCGLSIAEIEYLTQDSTSSRWLLAGTQDTGTIRYSGTTTFDTVGDGDGGDCAADQSQPGTCYHSYTNMGLDLSTSAGARGTFRPIGPDPSLPPGATQYSCLFYPPMAAAGGTVVQAGSSVFISRDQGKKWTELQFPVTGQTATALCAPSGDLIYAATSSGRIFKIAYAGGAWAAPAELPQRPRRAYVSAVAADPSASGRIWVTMSQLGGSTVFRSDDGGATWTDKTAGLPAIPINAVAVDNTNPDRVWVSADVGVYQSLDGGGTWSAFCQNLPNVLVADLEFHAASRLLRAATRSRGIWEVAVDQPGSSAPPPPGVNACSVLQNADGTLEAFGAGTGKALGHIRPDGSGPTGWSQWESLGGVITSALATAMNDDGTLEVFARGPDGALYHVYQVTVPSGRGWSQRWESLGGFLTGNPAAARNLGMPGTGGAGYLEVFARGPDGALHHNYQTSPGITWSGWTSLGGVITSTPAAALNADGCLSVFARQADGALGHIKQRNQGISSTWSTWESLTPGGVIAGKPAVAVTTDGRLDVSARQADGALGHIYQNAPVSAWSGWRPLPALGGVLAGDPAVTRNWYGGLDVFARGIDNGLYHIYQTGPGSGWSQWESLARDLTSDPAVALRQDGGLEAFARGTGNALYHTYQTFQGSSWSSWESLGGTLLGYP